MKSEIKTEMPEIPEMIPEKEYIFGTETVTSSEMATIIRYGVQKIDRELKIEKNPKKVKKLKDRKRLLNLYVFNDDINQFLR